MNDCIQINKITSADTVVSADLMVLDQGDGCGLKFEVGQLSSFFND